jgi:phosphotransferase system HPr (HPr) family protein
VQTSSDVASATAHVSLPDDVDLHARPAATFVRAAMGFSSSLWVAVGEREVDAKSLLSILALGAKGGTSLRLRAEGEDAVAAVDALCRTVSAVQE